MADSTSQPSAFRRVFGATIHYGLAAYVPRLVNFALLPVLAAYLTPADFGIIEICMAVQVLLRSTSRLGLPGALARQYFDHREGRAFRDLVLTTAASVLLSSAIFSVIALLVGPMIFTRFLPEMAFHPYVELALLVAFLQFAPELQLRVLQAKEASRLAAQITVIVALIAIAAKLVLVVGYEMGALGVLYADVAAASVALLIAVVRHREDLKGAFRRDLLKESLAFGVPLVPHRLGAWLHEFASRWILAAVGALASLGVFGMASRVASPIRIGMGAFTRAFPPIYFGWRKDLPEAEALVEIRKTARAVLTFGALASLGVATFGPFAVVYLMPPSYHEATAVVGVLASGLLLRIAYNLHGVELHFSKRTKPITLVFFFGSVVTISVTALLAPRWGGLGAAWGMVAGTIVSVITTAVLSTKTFPSPLDARAVLSLLVGAGLCVAGPQVVRFESLPLDAAATVGGFGVAALLVLALAGLPPKRLRAELSKLRKRKKKPAE